MEKAPLTKDQFVRELSLESGFTLADTRVFFESFLRVLRRCVSQRIPFIIKGFATLKFSTVKERDGYNAKTHEKTKFPKAVRITLSLAASVKDEFVDADSDECEQLTFI